MSKMNTAVLLSFTKHDNIVQNLDNLVMNVVAPDKGRPVFASMLDVFVKGCSSGAKHDLVLAGVSAYNKCMLSMIESMRFADVEVTNLGFPNVTFMGIPVVLNTGLDPEIMYFLDTQGLVLEREELRHKDELKPALHTKLILQEFEETETPMTNQDRLIEYNKNRAWNERLVVNNPEQYPPTVIESFIATHEFYQCKGPILSIVDEDENGSARITFIDMEQEK